MSGGVGQLVMNGPLILAVPLAEAAGAITFISPCCLPLIPGYLSYVTGMSGASAAGRSAGAGHRPAADPASASQAATAIRGARSGHRARASAGAAAVSSRPA